MMVSSKLDVILGADALTPPLTGIGRYTFELAQRLEPRDDVERLRYFALGRWIADPLTALAKPQPGAKPGQSGRSLLRRTLSNSRLAVRVFQGVTPSLFKWRLRGNRHAIFHAPDFIVPPFDGRTVSTVHDLSHLLYPEFHPPARVDYLNLALGKSLARADQIIADTEAVRLELLERGLAPPGRVSAVHLAADGAYRPHPQQELAPAMQALGLRANSYALFVGTVEPRKNVARLIEAYARLPAGLRRDCPLVIAGSIGWRSDDVHARMAQAQAEGWLRYLAFVDQRWLPALYAGAQLMAYPSLYEGFGLPIVEAMASGTPVLTSNVSCMPEVAGGAARLVNPLDLDEMTDALAQCLTDEAWQRAARGKGLARAAQFSWDRCADETVAVYHRARAG